MDLKKMNLAEMNSQEMKNVDGGIVPVVVLVGWGIMIGCAAVAEGFRQAMNDNKK